MSDKPISPLWQRMIDDMTARRFTEDTQRDYVRNVRNFAAFLGRSRDMATKEDLRRFQHHMAQRQIGASTINAAIAALRFFFQRDARPRPFNEDRDRAAQDAGRAEPAGDGAAPRSRPQPEVIPKVIAVDRRGPSLACRWR